MKSLPNFVTIALSMTVAAAIGWWAASVRQQEPLIMAVDQHAPVEQAAEVGAKSIDAIKAAIAQRFSESRPELVVSKVEASAIPGLYAVSIENGPVLYATADGAYFVMGDLFQSRPGGFVNIAEQAREGERAKAMAGVDVKDMIVFAPEKQPSKAVVNVFTDVDCYYCQKLHNEVPDLNKAGIEVRYLAFPRAGIGSESYNKIASAWCAQNQQVAITKLKRRQPIENNVCDGNPVAEQYQLGQQIGVNGTPALITSEGRLMPGYMPALQLAQALGVEVEPKLAAELRRKQEAQRQ